MAMPDSNINNNKKNLRMVYFLSLILFSMILFGINSGNDYFLYQVNNIIS